MNKVLTFSRNLLTFLENFVPGDMICEANCDTMVEILNSQHATRITACNE